ncbi:MAG TPA: hypothetical protein VIZ18_04785 [Ktedonobacteraceae bacterium]
MYEVEDKSIPPNSRGLGGLNPETIHLYVVRERPARPRYAPIVLSLFTLSLLIVLGVATPYQQPVVRAAIRVPAVPLGMRSFSASVAIVPTGVKTYPATYAHGVLTFTNGSVIGQNIPKGFTIMASNGILVMTDAAIYVPAATATSFGIVAVSARLDRDSVNLPAYSVSLVIGTSLFVRNLSAFTGGHKAYSVKYVTQQDRQIALLQARNKIAAMLSGFHYPCSESLRSAAILEVTWRCQFLTFSVPSYMHVSTVQLIRAQVIVHVWFVEHPKPIWVK